MDHAPVRRVRDRRGHQRALQVPARRRPDRPVVRLRPPHPDGLRLRPPPLRGRGGQGRRGHRHAGGHAAPARRPAARQGHDVDDHQRHGRHPPALLPTGGRGERRRPEAARRHHPERHPEGVRGPGHVHLPAPAFDATGHRHLLVLRREPAGVEHHLHLGLPHPRGRLDGRPGDRRSPWPTGSPTSRRPWPPGWPSTTSPRASASSGTPTTTCSRRWPSTGPPVGCGRRS